MMFDPQKLQYVLLTAVVLTTSCAAFFSYVADARAEIRLVKGPASSAVYYIDDRGVRHPFPSQNVYESWYGEDYSAVVTVSAQTLATYPMGSNVTMRPGTYLVKIATSPMVYAVERGGVLRAVESEEVAADIWGVDWKKRVRDVADVFFENYTIGAPISHGYTLPNDVVLFSPQKNSYFFKYNNTVRPFISEDAMAKNRINPKFALVSDREFSQRARPISNQDAIVFDPAALPLTSRLDCENTSLKAALVFVSDEKFSANELNNVKAVQTKIEKTYEWATDGLSSLDVSDPVVVMNGDSYILNTLPNGTIEVKNELINTFYDTHSDVYDFIIVWTNFKTPNESVNEMAHFTPVSNQMTGNGSRLLDRSNVFGSTGKLKGIIMMGNINKYAVTQQEGMNSALNYVLHEILHQWGAYAEFVNEAGLRDRTLLREDGQHWSNYAMFSSPLGGLDWQDNGNGTFTNGLLYHQDSLKRFSQLDLYLMGLIPRRYMTEPIDVVAPEQSRDGDNVIKGVKRTITIDQIVAANGTIGCVTQ